MLGGGRFRGTALDLQANISSLRRQGYKYVIVAHGLSPQNRPSNDTASQCLDYELAAFLLAVEEGCFIMCNGWDEVFARPLGNPLGPAEINGEGVMHRKFESGVVARWDTAKVRSKATVYWPGVPPPPPPPASSS